jgi:hypothetical protein
MNEVDLFLRVLDVVARDDEPLTLALAISGDGAPAANTRLGVVGPAPGIARIRETLAETWPRCGGHEPSAAEDWDREGFSAERVEAWLEVGVPFSLNAEQLEEARVEPADVLREHADGVTLGLAFARGGLAFARGELTIAQVQRAVLGPEVEG